MNEKLDFHSASLTKIESKLDSYGDRYKINQHNIERVGTRLTNIEKKLDIRPHEDLKVLHFAE